MEIKVGNHRRTRHDRSVFQLSAKNKTAKGLVPVHLAVEGQDMAILFFDEAGYYQDSMVALDDPDMTKAIARLLSMAWESGKWFWSTQPRVLTVNEEHRLEIPTSEFSEVLELLFGVSVERNWEPIVESYKFIGYRQVDNTRTAVITKMVSNVFSQPLRVEVEGEHGQVDHFSEESTGFIDLEGVPIARYTRRRVTGTRPDGRPFTVHWITLTTLAQ
ncbi:MAG: hypothetical protein ACE5MG_08735 [Candidatus Methylomirabilales bacterium]